MEEEEAGIGSSCAFLGLWEIIESGHFLCWLATFPFPSTHDHVSLTVWALLLYYRPYLRYVEVQ